MGHQLSRDGGLPHRGPHGEEWWHIFHSNHSTFRAAGFSPSGRTIAAATSSDLSLWTRSTDDRHRDGWDMTEFGWQSRRRWS